MCPLSLSFCVCLFNPYPFLFKLYCSHYSQSHLSGSWKKSNELLSYLQEWAHVQKIQKESVPHYRFITTAGLEWYQELMMAWCGMAILVFSTYSPNSTWPPWSHDLSSGDVACPLSDTIWKFESLIDSVILWPIFFWTQFQMTSSNVLLMVGNGAKNQLVMGGLVRWNWLVQKV